VKLSKLVILAAALPGLAFATMVQQVLIGARHTVNAGPGDQSDPHVSGDWVAYTSEDGLTSRIRYHQLSTGFDAEVPREGGLDFLSDISGATVVFTRVTAAGSAIRAYDVHTGEGAELDPVPSSARTQAAIGGGTVAWVDHGLANAPEIVAYDLATSQSTRVTSDGAYDTAPAVSPDGEWLVWRRCLGPSTGCDVVRAARGSGWADSVALTAGEGEEDHPDTDGQWVVYDSVRAGEKDIFLQPLAGGAERRIALAGIQQNPSIAGGLVAFESRGVEAASSFEIMLYDSATDALYQLTQSPVDEVLSDIDVAPDGLVRVVWTAREDGSANVYALSFRLGGPTQCAPTHCADPGSRPLYGTLTVTRTSDGPDRRHTTFAAVPTAGLLCLDNGAGGDPATAAVVALNSDVVVGPSEVKPKVAGLEKPVPLAETNTLVAVIAGEPGATYTVRVYGAEPACLLGELPSPESYRVRGLREGQLEKIMARVSDDSVGGAGGAVGCSSTRESGMGAVIVVLLAGWLLWPRPQPARVRARRR
jgi:hypothetical protein